MLGHYSIGSASLGATRDNLLIALLETVQAAGQVLDLDPKVTITLSTTSATGQVIDANFVLVGPLTTTSATGQVLDLGTPKITIPLSVISATAQVIDATFSFDLGGVPELVISRSGTTVTIDIDNLGSTDVKIYRAAGYRSLFSLVTTTASFPYDDTGLDASVHYRYKASFEKGGSEGRKSPVRYTKGT